MVDQTEFDRLLACAEIKHRHQAILSREFFYNGYGDETLGRRPRPGEMKGKYCGHRLMTAGVRLAAGALAYFTGTGIAVMGNQRATG